ncbi:MAG: hypothetical protein WAV20_10115, partial [Blastocatellia bacterium]
DILHNHIHPRTPVVQPGSTLNTSKGEQSGIACLGGSGFVPGNLNHRKEFSSTKQASRWTAAD